MSFQFELLPNDMKYLAFLGGELSISASYFSPFADINKKDIANTQEILVQNLKTNGIHGNIVKDLKWQLL